MVNVDLSTTLYQRIKEIADQEDKDVGEMIEWMSVNLMPAIMRDLQTMSENELDWVLDDNPKAGFVHGMFAIDNWHDPVLDMIRNNLDIDDANGLFWVGKEISGVDMGKVSVPYQKASFMVSEVETALGSGLVLCGHLVDQRYSLVKIKKIDKWFYISWYKNRGATEALLYLHEKQTGVFSVGNPVSYEDAIFLAHFMDSIQVKSPAKDIQLNKVYGHESEV
jgi:hypothetical protein